MKSPFFSIIVVSLNAGKLIKSTIESVLTQGFQNFEIIVKDGCSRDDTINQIPRSDKIQVFVEPDLGIYDAMNQATSYADGKYLCFLNCGDMFADNDVLENIFKTASIYEINKYNLIYSDFIRKGIYIKAPALISDFYLFRTPLNHQSMFFEKSAIIKYGMYNLKYKILSDYDLTLKLYINKVNFVYCNCLSTIYLGDGISESKNGKIQKKIELKNIRKTYYKNSKYIYFSFILILSLRNLRNLIASDNSPFFIRNNYRKFINFFNGLRRDNKK